jgi:hypothetical protein
MSAMELTLEAEAEVLKQAAWTRELPAGPQRWPPGK